MGAYKEFDKVITEVNPMQLSDQEENEMKQPQSNRMKNCENRQDLDKH